ncbi:unnamed protein product [Arctia plantaginis]|uniref:Uncharacterized protein n=1 Tax=Arctia plantaginis TaxID=874455 RepID=A0A8S0Z0X7_ARCPL|nr:unnamed protein product [Arctia plantaginis]
MATCCVPCPAAAPCAMSAGIKSGLRDDKPIDGKQDCGNYACDSCCRRPSMFGPCYKQPRIPDSYAPRRCYMRPCAPMQSTTTYNMSYLPATGCSNLRGMMRKPLPNLVPSCEPMESCTIQKLSFLPNPVHVTQPIRPCHHDMWGQGPMQNITTQRHDYVPKPSIPRPSCRPPHKFHCIEQPFERRTINRLSYVDPGRCPVTPSYAPLNCYERASAPMECSTIHKMSYQPVCAPQPQRPPWSCKGQYQKPCQRLESATTYRMSFPAPGVDCIQYMNPCSYGDCKPCNTFSPPTCYTTNPCCCNFPRAACCG